MPFALVPEGFELKKVSKLQKEAVDRYYRQQSLNTLLENPTTVPLIASAITAVVGGVLLDRFLEDLDLPQTPDIVGKVEAAKKKALSIPEDIVTKSFETGVDIGVGLREQLAKLVPDVKIPKELEKFQIRGLA